MKESEFKKLAITAKRLKMSDPEKARVRSLLLEYMSREPVRVSGNERLQWRKRSLNPLIHNVVTSLRYMAIALIIALIVGGGVSAASQNTLPGDALYGVKVGFTEEIRSAVTFSEEAKARFEVQRAERRLEEAEKLAAQSELNAETQANIEANFTAHADRVKERIARLEAKANHNAAASISSNFETALRVHEEILVRLSQEKPESRGELIDLGAAVRARVQTVAEARTNAEANVSASAEADVRVAAEGALRSARNRIEEVRRLIERKGSALSAEAMARAEARLGVAEQTIAEGEAKLNAQAYGEAFVLFRQAYRLAQEAELIIEAQSNLDVELDIDAGINIRSGEGVLFPTNENTSGQVESSTDVDAGGGIRVEVGL